MRHFITLGLMLLAAVTASADNVNAADGVKQPARFSWGAEIGPAIDMGGDDMSSLNIAAMFGYSGPYLQLAGIGAGIDMMISNSRRAFPVYAVVRSSFTRRPSLLFADLRAGIAYNQVEGMPDRTCLLLQPGVGVRLAAGRKFASSLTLAYTYNDMTFWGERQGSLIHGLNMATIALGITF